MYVANAVNCRLVWASCIIKEDEEQKSIMSQRSITSLKPHQEAILPLTLIWGRFMLKDQAAQSRITLLHLITSARLRKRCVMASICVNAKFPYCPLEKHNQLYFDKQKACKNSQFLVAFYKCPNQQSEGIITVLNFFLGFID